jgi:diguanylate cyclase (GGDEF)-like protein
MVRIEGAFLRSAVGRRIFGLFLLASIVPVVLIATLTYQGVTSLLTRQSSAELVRYSKNYAMGVVGRLQAARAALRNLEGAQERGAARAEGGAAPAPAGFVSLVTLDARGEVSRLLLGSRPPAESLQRLAEVFVANRNPRADVAIVAVPAIDPAEPSLVLILRPAGRADLARERLVAVLDPAYVFGDSELLPAQTDLCVLAAGLALHCSDPSLVVLARQAAEGPPAAPLLDAAQRDRDVGAWTLLLGTDFVAPSWTFVAMRSSQVGALAGRQMGRTYIAVGAACLLLVALLSLSQIRRILVPLERLVEGTRRLGAGDFSRPIDIGRTDEFGRLAESFNRMAAQLEIQIGTLKTLSSIDQEILAGLEVDRVIERVLPRMRDLIPGATAALAVLPAHQEAAGAATLWRLREGAVGKATLPLSPDEQSSLAAAGEQAVSRADPPASAGALAQALSEPGIGTCFWTPVRSRSGATVVAALGLPGDRAPEQPVREHLRELGNRVCVAFEAAERERQLVHEARHDSLTGLPNRRQLHEIIQQRTDPSNANPSPFAILFIDLDRFKGVNDGLGHDTGDALLQQASGRIRRCTGPGDTVARLGGDEFIVLSEAGSTDDEAVRLADRIIESLSQPFWIGAIEVYVGASIGVTSYPRDGGNRETLLRNADIAMYRAKKSGRGRCALYQATMSRPAIDVLVLEKDLRAALARDEIGVVFQPRVHLHDRRVVGAEALARWQHSTRGSVSPATFIPLAEEIGVMDTLGIQVLTKTCARLSQWRRHGLAVDAVSVNLSPRQLRSRDLASVVSEVVARAGLQPADIELEITEGALVDDLDVTRAILHQLREAGFRIALDDFGTGYSSLSYLKTLPIDVMKVDRSFVIDLARNTGSQAIANAIITMAHTVGIRVVAEGIETAEQANLLRKWGCDEGQGYLFARPMPAGDFEAFVTASEPAVSVA